MKIYGITKSLILLYSTFSSSLICILLFHTIIFVFSVRISNDQSLPEKLRRNYKGVFDAFHRILKEEGATTFFSGSGPLVNRAMLVGAVQVFISNDFKMMMLIVMKMFMAW